MSSKKTKIFSTVFNRSMESASFVFSKVTQYFSIYWISFMLTTFFALQFFLGTVPFKLIVANIFDKIFLLFIAPYWVYVFIKKTSAISFWNFVRVNVNPLIINYIKVFFIIVASPLFSFGSLIKRFISVLRGNLSIQNISYSIFLIILVTLAYHSFRMGMHSSSVRIATLAIIAPLSLFIIIKKSIEYLLITSASLFTENKRMAIKEAHRLGKGHLIFMFCVFILLLPLALNMISIILKAFLFFLPSSNFLTAFLKDGIIYVSTFYFQTFIYIFTTHFYFLMKDMKS